MGVARCFRRYWAGAACPEQDADAPLIGWLGGIGIRGRLPLTRAKGFTLIELLIVVVIIGILVTIAIPKFSNIKERTYVASMQSDLRILATVEEAYFSDWVTYTGTITNLNYLASPGNAVSITGANSMGWSATVSSNGTTKTCGIYIGTVTPPSGVPVEGRPTCQ
jgi:prepilin-type N-terminal cleavage/methylation domain-containing protein